MDWEKVGEVVVTAGATLGAAYWGARAAFDFNRRQEAGRTRVQQVEECNRAMLILARQYNHLLVCRDQLLNPVRAHPARHLLMRPSKEPDYSSWTVNAPALSFLLQTLAEELPFMLAMVDQRFHSAVAAISARSLVHEEFQRTYEQSGNANVRSTLEEVEAAIGERLAKTLKSATDQVYDLVDGAIKDHEAAGKDARRVLNTLFPGAKIMGFAAPLPTTAK
jgi:hypothetical protein